MDRREFLLKLGKSVLVITAVTVTGRLLSKKEFGSEACAPESSCVGCASLQRCGLPKRNAYMSRNEQSGSEASLKKTVNNLSTENG